jgi:hypothetical protein
MDAHRGGRLIAVATRIPIERRHSDSYDLGQSPDDDTDLPVDYSMSSLHRPTETDESAKSENSLDYGSDGLSDSSGFGSPPEPVDALNVINRLCPQPPELPHHAALQLFLQARQQQHFDLQAPASWQRSPSPPPAPSPAAASCRGQDRDSAYWERRRKNNEAAKRSRDARRLKEQQVAARAQLLEQENLQLKLSLAQLRAETFQLRQQVYSLQNAGAGHH